jgi:hypothetical protein
VLIVAELQPTQLQDEAVLLRQCGGRLAGEQNMAVRWPGSTYRSSRPGVASSYRSASPEPAEHRATSNGLRGRTLLLTRQSAFGFGIPVCFGRTTIHDSFFCRFLLSFHCITVAD